MQDFWGETSIFLCNTETFWDLFYIVNARSRHSVHMSSTNKEKQTNQYFKTFSTMQKLETVGALWDCEMHIPVTAKKKKQDCETGEIWQNVLRDPWFKKDHSHSLLLRTIL